MSDTDEAVYGTDPFNPDTDADGSYDGTEVDIAAGSGCPDPLVVDSDGDTISDGDEIAAGTDACNVDTDGDGIPDNEDPFPTEPDITGGFIAEALRDLCNYVAGLDLSLFDAPNNNARKGRRNAMCNKLNQAANMTEADDFTGAIDELTSLLAKLDGDPHLPDWMIESSEKDQLRGDIEAAILLLELL